MYLEISEKILLIIIAIALLTAGILTGLYFFKYGIVPVLHYLWGLI